MRYSYLTQIVAYMQQFTQITSAHRVSDTQIRIVFDRENVWNFEMQRGAATIFIAESQSRGKIYQAPFDVLLAKRFNRSNIQSVALHNNDKIIRITVTQSGSYKSETTILQFEFTGKHTNVIILDKEETVLEALRHIDVNLSSRSVRVGQKLIDPPPLPFIPQEYPLDDVRAFLLNEYRRWSEGKLEKLKKEKSALLKKRRDQLFIHLQELENEELYAVEAEKAQHIGHLILANLDRVKPYETEVALEDFDGKQVTVELPKGMSSGAMMAESFFKRSKKAKQKGQGLYKERHNLEEKIHHLDLFIQTVNETRSPEELALLFPPKAAGGKTKPSESIAEFWIEGHKVSLGKNEKGNIELLRNAKSRDIWLHLKDRPSAHVIITTDKQQLPLHLLEAAAKLCVDFSVFEKGRYLVDYTPRREVKMQEGANVLYTKYNTIAVEKG